MPPLQPPSTTGASLSLQQVIERLDEIPPLPESTLRLAELIEDPSTTPLSLARLIEKDLSLAARVLRLANSAFYGVSGGVDSLERAVCFVGFSTIQQIAVYLQSRQILDGAGARSPAALWRHAQQVARAAQHLAASLRLPMAQRFYTAGLLHDLGRVALFVLFPERAARWNPSGQDLWRRIEAERALFGIDHQQAGVHLARRWRYPEALMAVIAGCHPVPGVAPPASPEQEALLAVVAYADGCARAAEPAGIPGTAAGPDPAWLPRLGLPAERHRDIEEQVRQNLSLNNLDEA